MTPVSNNSTQAEEIQEKTRKIAEQFYGTQSDPDQIPITAESAAKLNNVTDKWFNCALDEKGEPISWIIVFPTSLNIMNQFLKGQLTERQLFDQTTAETPQEALYLCSAFTVPNHRRQGLAMSLITETIINFEKSGPVELFAWPFSQEGKNMTKMAEKFNRKIHLRKI